MNGNPWNSASEANQILFQQAPAFLPPTGIVNIGVVPALLRSTAAYCYKELSTSLVVHCLKCIAYHLIQSRQDISLRWATKV